MMEQIPLDFSEPLPVPEKPIGKLEILSTEELEKQYHKNVGKDPCHRFHDVTEDERREYLIEGIKDKDAALYRRCHR